MKETLKPKLPLLPGLSLKLSPDAERFLLIGAMIFAITLPLTLNWITAALDPAPPLAKVPSLLPASQTKTTTPFCVDVTTDGASCQGTKPLQPKQP